MFNRKKTDLRMINPTSKISLKMSCIEASNGDLVKAKELYDYFADGVDIPDYPIQKPNIVQQFTQQANEMFGWIDQNSERIMKGYNMIQMMRGGNIIPAATEAAAETVEDAIPPLPPLE